MEIIDKKVSKAFGKNIYLLGQGEDGVNYWLEESTFDCGWYWSLGYIESYTHNTRPARPGKPQLKPRAHADQCTGRLQRQ